MIDGRVLLRLDLTACGWLVSCFLMIRPLILFTRRESALAIRTSDGGVSSAPQRILPAISL